MTWTIELSESAIKHLKKLPLDWRTWRAQAIDQMEADPLAGDVIALKGENFLHL